MPFARDSRKPHWSPGSTVAQSPSTGSSIPAVALLWMILAISGITMLIVLAAWMRRPEVVTAGSERVDVLAARA